MAKLTVTIAGSPAFCLPLLPTVITKGLGGGDPLEGPGSGNHLEGPGGSEKCKGPGGLSVVVKEGVAGPATVGHAATEYGAEGPAGGVEEAAADGAAAATAGPAAEGPAGGAEESAADRAAAAFSNGGSGSDWVWSGGASRGIRRGSSRWGGGSDWVWSGGASRWGGSRSSGSSGSRDSNMGGSSGGGRSHVLQ